MRLRDGRGRFRCATARHKTANYRNKCERWGGGDQVPGCPLKLVPPPFCYFLQTVSVSQRGRSGAASLCTEPECDAPFSAPDPA